MDGVKAINTLVNLRLASDRRLFGPEHDSDYHRSRHQALARAHPLTRGQHENTT